LGLFSNQFNIALDLDAARFVLSNFHQFQSFVLVPTDATRSVMYSLAGLCKEDPSLAKRFLGFNYHIDAMKLATGEVTPDAIVGRSCAVPDLTAFLYAFSAGFKGLALGSASIMDKDDQLAMSRVSSGIPILEMQGPPLSLSDADIRRIWSTLSVDGNLLGPCNLGANLERLVRRPAML
jgi:hypothetical protein